VKMMLVNSNCRNSCPQQIEESSCGKKIKDSVLLTITYRMENDLTLQQLDDFLTVLLYRFQTMFDEMKVLDETLRA
jgi:hypothetical protein